MSEMTFEKAVKDLEKITVALESGELGLEDSMKYYEQGTKLAAFCSEKLKQAELKIQQLSGFPENNEG
ncbi:MAG: exodeoxyribonuclease VII small subunit [Clostridia bacterium]|nr:exodeoxyribonuclease VII small subunit [Clostridia bacterium]